MTPVRQASHLKGSAHLLIIDNHPGPHIGPLGGQSYPSKLSRLSISPVNISLRLKCHASRTSEPFNGIPYHITSHGYSHHTGYTYPRLPISVPARRGGSTLAPGPDSIRQICTPFVLRLIVTMLVNRTLSILQQWKDVRRQITYSSLGWRPSPLRPTTPHLCADTLRRGRGNDTTGIWKWFRILESLHEAQSRRSPRSLYHLSRTCFLPLHQSSYACNLPIALASSRY